MRQQTTRICCMNVFDSSSSAIGVGFFDVHRVN
jgi:hypothetical protein